VGVTNGVVAQLTQSRPLTQLDSNGKYYQLN